MVGRDQEMPVDSLSHSSRLFIQSTTLFSPPDTRNSFVAPLSTARRAPPTDKEMVSKFMEWAASIRCKEFQRAYQKGGSGKEIHG